MDLNWGQLINEISRCAEIVIRRRMPWLPGESDIYLSTLAWKVQLGCARDNGSAGTTYR